MLDDVHPSLLNAVGDDNIYTLGHIGHHNIVILLSPFKSGGLSSAATMMTHSFGRIRFCLLVGVGGGVPTQGADVRLGDVVVGSSGAISGGVALYAFDDSLLTARLQAVGTTVKSYSTLLTALSSLQASHMIEGSRLPEHLSGMAARYPALAWESRYPGQNHDELFEAQCEHNDPQRSCDHCDRSQLVTRPPRARRDPVIHYGLIASSNTLMTDGKFRDEVASERGALCFGGPTAWLTSPYPHLVIRGICDYADQHSTFQWVSYAAATAAAYAKELLSVIPEIQSSQPTTANPNTIATLTPLSGAESLSLNGDPKLQAAILKYNTEIVAQRLQAAYAELCPDNPDVVREQTDDRSLSLYAKDNKAGLPTPFSQLVGSIYRTPGFLAPSTAGHIHSIFPLSLAVESDPSRPRHRRDFKIALICALPLEADAVKAVFDKRWDGDGDIYGKAPRDQNAYSTGLVGRHNVVLAHMPAIGKEAAASVAANLRSSFEGLQLALVVGICGAVPVTPEGKEIFLGDVIISEGIIRYDLGRQYPDRFARKDKVLDSLGRPNAEIRALIAKLKGRWDHKNLEAKVSKYLPRLQQDIGEASMYPGAGQDKSFVSSYRHKHWRLSGCDVCEACSHKTDPVCDEALKLTCEQLNCGEDELIFRSRLEKSGANGTMKEQTSYEPKVHFGLVASGDSVIKSGEHRDQVAMKEMVIAFEMEGAGVWDILPCLVIKGVCDYADCHKSKKWQNYAALSAAACMKAFLESWTAHSTDF